MLGPNLLVHGRLSGKGDVVVDGRLEGDVAVEGTVTIGVNGVVVAAVEAETVIVDGVVQGNVRGSTAVAVRAGGRVEGDVRSPRVAIDDGGTLQGGIEMEFDLPPGLEPEPGEPR